MWVLIKANKQHLIRTAIEGVYSMPNLDVVEVSSIVPLLSLDFIERHGLKLRDAFHASVMKEKNVNAIVSDDDDFDRIEWIKRVNF